MTSPLRIITVLGPTASGKTALAVRLARALNGEIISADSRQVYKGLDIGSGKDLSEYVTGGEPVRTHLLDLVDPAEAEPYTLADFMRDAKCAIADISARGNVPILCGGTGLYLHALMKGYELPGGPADRDFRKTIRTESTDQLTERLRQKPVAGCGETDNPYRLSRKIEIESSDRKSAQYGGPVKNAEYLVLGAFRPRSVIHNRIQKRLDDRFDGGMTEEVRRLHERGVSWEKLESFGLEYREISLCLQEKKTVREMHDELLIRIRQFAKRQDTWFRKMVREGIAIHWLPPDDADQAIAICRAFLANGALPRD